MKNQYRNNPAFIPELDFVMEEDGKIIGHVSEPIGCIGYFVYGESNIKIGDCSQLQLGSDRPVKIMRLDRK